ncbi:conserved Plasmodium protein, unknown function [Plasmodium malariae]|uniref:Importin N-terminal domain-containing protein n=2 Tax=Plasmodium malariae TaxID=5858 RepID=A0A1C3KET0_PLAMA|nr:conserved Plasmodium protein, unknown function [Plasmodium malariae]
MEREVQQRKIIDALYDSWSNDEGRRKESEQILNEYEKEEFFIMCLLDICMYKSVHYNIRKLCIIYCKNLVVRYWHCRDELQYNNDVKKVVKGKIIEILNDVDNLINYYKEFCILLKKIARYELVHNFPELLECFLYNINIQKNNLNNLFIYLYLLHKILREQYNKKLLKDKKETFDISEKFIYTLGPFWNNSFNKYFQNNFEGPCICNNEEKCNKCYTIYNLIKECEKKLSFGEINQRVDTHEVDTILSATTVIRSSSSSTSSVKARYDNCDIGTDSSSQDHRCTDTTVQDNHDPTSDKKIKILKFLDSIILNLIINRNDIMKGMSSGTITGSTNRSEESGSINNMDSEWRKSFFNALINKTIYFLKFINKNSAVYYLKYLKFLLSSFLLMIEFHSCFHVYLKREITEKFICLFLKKNINIELNNYMNNYENKFVEIVNLCISILKSIFYHFCLNQYNLIKQKKVRENYLNVKNMICNSQDVHFDGYNDNTLEAKIMTNFVMNVKNVDCENNKKSSLFNKNLSFKDILTYIREEVKQALTNDDFILMHNQKALEIFDFLRLYCINISSEQIIDVTLNIKDDYETEENVFYNNAKDCLVQLSSEPFLFSIFNHFFEPLINSFHNYAHYLNNLPTNLKSIQISDFSQAIINLDGYLNIYYILYPSFHKKIKIEHILCMIQFFIDYLSIEYTHPLISYRIALIIKIWLKNYKVSFPFIDDITLLIYENIRLLYIHLLHKSVKSLIATRPVDSDNSNLQHHYALKSANFMPLLFFKFICLFKYIFKYEYVYSNYDYINEFLVGSLITILTKISFPKNIQKILEILSHIVFISNKEKDITIFKDNYNFLLDLYMNSNISIKEYLLNILVQILNKNFECGESLSEFMNKERISSSHHSGNQTIDQHVSNTSNQRGNQTNDQRDNHTNDQRANQSNSPSRKEKTCDDVILFYFSLDIIFYTLKAREQSFVYEENKGKGIALMNCSSGKSSIYPFTWEYSSYVKEVNLDIDKTINDNFYSLWLCILKLLSKMISPKNEEIIKKMCSLYISTTKFLCAYFKKLEEGLVPFEISNSCFDVIMEYFCLFIIHERHNYYLTFESVSTKILTNDILKNNMLSIVYNSFVLNDEGKMEKCIYILHLCLSIYKNDIKKEMPSLFSYIANFIVIFLIKVLLKYFSKYFNFYKYIKNIRRHGNQKNSNSSTNVCNSEEDNYDNTGISLFLSSENLTRDEKNKMTGSIYYTSSSTNKYNKNEEINIKIGNYNKSHIKYIYDNIINYKHDENFVSDFFNFQNDIKRLLNITYLNNYDITVTFKNYNFYTVNEDNYTYVNKHSVYTLISIMSLYEANFLNFVLISFLSYFKISISLFIYSLFYQSQYIHNKNILISLLIFIYTLTQNYMFTDFASSIFVHTNFQNIACSKSFENFIFDKNKTTHLFICDKDEHILLVIELLKLINNILNTNKDIYIEKKNILHLSTVTSSLSGHKIFHSYNYNLILSKILKYDEFSNICNKALENVLTHLLDVSDVEEKNRKKIVVNYLKENIDNMNIALIDMYKKYVSSL